MGKYMYGDRQTWEDIDNNKKEYETRVTSFYNYLKNNGMRVYVNKFGEEIDLNKYFADDVEYSLKRYLTSNDKFSESALKKHKDKLQRVNDELDGYISGGLTLNKNNDRLRGFMQAYARMRNLEDMVRKSKVLVAKQKIVKKIFGNYTVEKGKKNSEIKIYKSSQELLEERNARLAILNEVYNDNKLDKEHFAYYVQTVVDCYNIDIQNALDREVETIEEEKSDIKLKSMLKIIKNFYNIGNQTENVEKEDLLNAKTVVNNTNAINALLEAQRFIEDETTKSILLQTTKDILRETPIMQNPRVDALFDVLLDAKQDPFDYSLYKSEKSDIINNKKFGEFQKRSMMMSPMMIKNDSYKVKSQKYLEEEEKKVINFLLRQSTHKQIFKARGVKRMKVDYKFDDILAQILYEEVKKVYATLEMQRQICALYEKDKQEIVNKIAQNIAESEKTVSGK